MRDDPSLRLIHHGSPVVTRHWAEVLKAGQQDVVASLYWHFCTTKPATRERGLWGFVEGLAKATQVSGREGVLNWRREQKKTDLVRGPMQFFLGASIPLPLLNETSCVRLHGSQTPIRSQRRSPQVVSFLHRLLQLCWYRSTSMRITRSDHTCKSHFTFYCYERQLPSGSHVERGLDSFKIGIR